MSKTLSEQARALEIQLEKTLQERDAYEEEMQARGQSLANVAAERDALAVKLEKVRTDCIDCLNSGADDDFERGMDAQCKTTLAILNADYSTPSGTPPKTEQQEENEVKQECAHCARLAEIGQPPASGHRCPSDWSAYPRATTPVSGSSASQSEPQADTNGVMQQLFTITGPGFYRQRDGGKAEVNHTDPHPSKTVAGRCADGSRGVWFTNGRQYSGSTELYNDLVAPWSEPAEEEELDVMEREVVLHKHGDKLSLWEAVEHDTAMPDGTVTARATVQFKVPRPKPAKPKVTASVKRNSTGDVFVHLGDDDLVMHGVNTNYFTREQAVALRDALIKVLGKESA